MQALRNRKAWEAISHELVVVCNEAARRRALLLKPAKARYFKPLSDAYIQDRLYYDDPCFGYSLRDAASKQLQGFVLATNWTVWQKTFQFAPVDTPNAFVSLQDRSQHRCDSSGLAAALNACHRHGDPRKEGVIWDRVCEVSLLGALGCGRWLLFRLFRHLLQARTHDFVVLQATHAAIPFYERLGFVRVGTVAMARDNAELPPVAYRHWTASWHAVRATKGSYEDASYIMVRCRAFVLCDRTILGVLCSSVPCLVVLHQGLDLRALNLRDIRSHSYDAVLRVQEERWSRFNREYTKRSAGTHATAKELAAALLQDAEGIDAAAEGGAFTVEELVGQAFRFAKEASEHKVAAALQRVLRDIKASSPGKMGFGSVIATKAADAARKAARSTRRKTLRSSTKAPPAPKIDFSVVEKCQESLSAVRAELESGENVGQDTESESESDDDTEGDEMFDDDQQDDEDYVEEVEPTSSLTHRCKKCRRLFGSEIALSTHSRHCRHVSSKPAYSLRSHKPQRESPGTKRPERVSSSPGPTKPANTTRRKRPAASLSTAASPRPTRPKRSTRSIINYNVDAMLAQLASPLG